METKGRRKPDIVIQPNLEDLQKKVLATDEGVHFDTRTAARIHLGSLCCYYLTNEGGLIRKEDWLLSQTVNDPGKTQEFPKCGHKESTD